MKLTAFRIKDFKSIIDTGLCQTSSDNITAIIGQNEAGKTAVLEALYCFDQGELKEDYLKDADLYPEVTCTYAFSEEELAEILIEYDGAKPVTDYFHKNGNIIILKRTWTGLDKETSTLDIENDDLREIIESVSTSQPAPEPPAEEPGAEEAPAENEAEPAATETKALPKALDYTDLVEQIYSHTPSIEFFEDLGSLLPATIDLSEIDNTSSQAPGIKGARNFLRIVDLNSSDLAQTHARTLGKKVRRANLALTHQFQEFWRQYIGKSSKIEIEVELKNHDDKDPELAGKPYLSFWVKDSQELLRPDQRSKGVQWFLSFFLQLNAMAKVENNNDILLIDEPGASLHAKAQKDVLKVFEDIRKNLQIFYTTHSPYLIEPESLYRLLAVQRSDVDDENSETNVFDIHKLGAANRDTLFPVYTLIGVSLDHQKAIKNKNNIILEEPSAFYYLKAFKKLIGETHETNFLPATGVTNIPLLVNLFLGWDLDFVVLTDDDPAGKSVRREIKRDVFGGDPTLSSNKLIGVGVDGIEDIFTKGDFKKHVIGNSSVRYTTTNSKYLLDNNLPKLISAIKFYKKVKDSKLKLTDLRSTTQASIKSLITNLVSKL